MYIMGENHTQCHDEWDILLVQPKETVRKMFYPSFFIVNRKVTIVNCSLFTLRMILFYTDELNQPTNERTKDIHAHPIKLKTNSKRKEKQIITLESMDQWSIFLAYD